MFSSPSKSFEEQRRERLADPISEYLDDEDCLSSKFLDDLQVVLIKGRQYFANRADAYTHIIDFFQ